jgi:hypothetical protein
MAAPAYGFPKHHNHDKARTKSIILYCFVAVVGVAVVVKVAVVDMWLYHPITVAIVEVIV